MGFYFVLHIFCVRDQPQVGYPIVMPYAVFVVNNYVVGRPLTMHVSPSDTVSLVRGFSQIQF